MIETGSATTSLRREARCEAQDTLVATSHGRPRGIGRCGEVLHNRGPERQLVGARARTITGPMSMDRPFTMTQLPSGKTHGTYHWMYIGILRQSPSLRHARFGSAVR